MAQLKCKACGYIIDEKRLGDVCPACGVPKKAFEPWTDDMSPRRRTLLALNLHPIALHFPQAFSAMIPVFIIADLMMPLPFGFEVSQAVRLLSVLVFPFALAAFASGIIDGMTRFKRLGAPSLVRKIVLGCTFLAASFLLSLVAILNEALDPVRWYVFGLAVLCIGLQVALAQIGKHLMCIYLPGK
ncbi:MAG TPA: rubrerythrin [Spirochaetota bacterium]|nr:rubrerythrin [Spirochaetota bacterium]